MIKTLYMPIIEQGARHKVAAQNKTGLYEALSKLGECVQYDYLLYQAALKSPTRFYDDVADLVAKTKPDLIFTQFHGFNILNCQQIMQMRQIVPDAKWANWNGDGYRDALLKPEMIEFFNAYDLALTVLPDVALALRESGVQAQYWQVGIEALDADIPDTPAHDVVFLANPYTDRRRKLGEALYTYCLGHGYDLGLYGDGWGSKSSGNTTYDFPYNKGLYSRAKIAVADCSFEGQTYISDRTVQILAVGGAVLMQEAGPDLTELLDLPASYVHALYWSDHEQLFDLIDYHIKHRDDQLIPAIETDAEMLESHMRQYHTFDRRVEQLKGWLYG